MHFCTRSKESSHGVLFCTIRAQDPRTAFLIFNLRDRCRLQNSPNCVHRKGIELAVCSERVCNFAALLWSSCTGYHLPPLLRCSCTFPDRESLIGKFWTQHRQYGLD